MKRRRWIIAALAGIVIAGLGFGAWQTGQAAQLTATQETADAAGYDTSTVRKGSLSVSVTGTGKIVSSQAADLAFSTSGEVATLTVQVGDTVTAGQALATLSGTAALELKVREQEVAVETAQKTLTNLTANADANLAQAAVDQADAQATYEDAQYNLRKKEQGRCEKSVTESYYQQWLDLQGKIKPWAIALYTGKTGYGRDYILEHLNPLKKKAYIAWANYSYCYTFTDEEIETSQATLAVAKANNDQATRTYQSLKASSGVDTTELEIAQAALKNAQLQLIQAQKDLAGTTLTAPIDGTITAVSGEVGDPAGTGVFLTITNQDHPQMQVSIDETDLENFTSGCPATVTFDALSGQSFSGTVSQVSPTMATSSGASTVEGLVDLDKGRTLSGKAFPIGLGGTVEVTCSQANDVLLVAAQALYQPKNGAPYVYVLNAQGQPEKREVEIGLKTVALAEVKSGLAEGEKVIISAVEGNRKAASGTPAAGSN